MADKENKRFVFRFNLSWIYFILILGIGFLLLKNSGPGPQKVEWTQVKQMILNGDVKEIRFVRNDYKGNITIKPESLGSYMELFPGGQIPSKSPHFTFLVSDKFDAENEFEALGSELAISKPDATPVKYIIENDSKMWRNVLDWLIWPVLIIG